MGKRFFRFINGEFFAEDALIFPVTELGTELIRRRRSVKDIGCRLGIQRKNLIPVQDKEGNRVKIGFPRDPQYTLVVGFAANRFFDEVVVFIPAAQRRFLLDGAVILPFGGETFSALCQLFCREVTLLGVGLPSRWIESNDQDEGKKQAEHSFSCSHCSVLLKVNTSKPSRPTKRLGKCGGMRKWGFLSVKTGQSGKKTSPKTGEQGVADATLWHKSQKREILVIVHKEYNR